MITKIFMMSQPVQAHNNTASQDVVAHVTAEQPTQLSPPADTVMMEPLTSYKRPLEKEEKEDEEEDEEMSEEVKYRRVPEQTQHSNKQRPRLTGQYMKDPGQATIAMMVTYHEYGKADITDSIPLRLSMSVEEVKTLLTNAYCQYK